MTNCPNCNAPIEPYKCKCEYCGTYYFDFTALDLTGNKPYYVKFKTQDKVITALARPILETIDLSTDTTDIFDGRGIIHRYYGSRHCDLNVRFQCYEDSEKKSLFQIELMED